MCDKSAAILNVDHDTRARSSRSRLLQHAGFRVAEAVTGLEALHHVRTEPPDIVMLPRMLPDLDSDEVCRRIKAELAHALVVLTAAEDERPRFGWRGGWPDAFLPTGCEGSKLVGMVRTLLRQRKLEAGKAVPQTEIFAIQQSLSRLFDRFAPLAREKGLQLKIIPSSAQVRSDSELLAIALEALVANAIQYTDEGFVLVGCRREGEELSIQVIDTGHGVARECQRNIFAASAWAAVAPGIGPGLGLAFVSRIADLLGHRLSLHSVPGRGSRFTVTVPLAQP